METATHPTTNRKEKTMITPNPKCDHDHKDCFGYINAHCAILTSPIRNKPDCPFYKTQARIEQERQNVANRLN
jgi:hypothetical protein